jgi:hypothetical protein
MRFCWLLLLWSATPVLAQDNYEIQVYPSEVVAPHQTMVEVHSNFTFSGSKSVVDGVDPTEHALHETLEITHGFTPWFETGFYVFTSARSGRGWEWVGDHIRPRISVPAEWKWHVGLSLSGEFGYQRRRYAADSWTLELRPIIDKQLGRWYLSFNPTIDRSLHGLNQHRGWNFSPNAKAGYDITKKVNAGVEYYASMGPITGFDPLSQQQQQIVPAIDPNLSPNLGVQRRHRRGRHRRDRPPVGEDDHRLPL